MYIQKFISMIFIKAMKENPDKCLFLSNLAMNTKISVSIFYIGNTHTQKLLGVTIDPELNFLDHVSSLCKKHCVKNVQIQSCFWFLFSCIQPKYRKIRTRNNSVFENFSRSESKRVKISAMVGVFTFMLLNQNKLIMKTISMLQFGDFPLVWMNHNRTLNNRINSSHEKTLPRVYNNFKSLFHQLLEKDNPIAVHQHDLQTLAIEIFKFRYSTRNYDGCIRN